MDRTVPTFDLVPGSRFAASIGSKWSLVPLCIPTGWAVRWNGIDARALPSGQFECNDSEDLFWAVKLPPPDTHVYSTDPTSTWREIAIDAGWYRDHFRIVMLDPDWEHVRRSYSTASFEEFIAQLEKWMLEIPGDGEVKVFDAPSSAI
jgi:hypothetical protein